MKKLLFFIFILSFSLASVADEIRIRAFREMLVLPAPAKRIIVLEFSLLDDLLQLGIKPIGIVASHMEDGVHPPYMLPQGNDVEIVGTRSQPDLEKITALKPDLIIADQTLQADLYPTLRQIAPTLLLNGVQGLVEVQIKNLEILAKATHTEDKVPGIVKALKSQYTHMKQFAIHQVGTVLIGSVNAAGKFQALAANALASDILQDFGYKNLITITRSERTLPLSLKRILELDPDKIVLLISDGNQQAHALLMQNQVWQSIRAVREKHVYIMDSDKWTKVHGILATQLLLQEVYDSGFLTDKVSS